MSVILSELLRVPSTGSLTWFERSSNYTASNLDGIIADTSGGSFTVTLPPTPELGDTVGIIDSKGTFNTNNLIVTSSDNIQGSVNDLTLDINQASFELVYTGATLGWQLKTFLPAKVDSVNNSTGDLVSSLVEDEVSITAATTLTSSAFGKNHVVSGTTADYDIDLPTATDNSGMIIGIRIAGSATKLFTIKGNGTQEIDGENERVMWAGESAILLCDGSGWTKIAGKSIPFVINGEKTTAQSASANVNTKVVYQTVNEPKSGIFNSSTFTVPRRSDWNMTMNLVENAGAVNHRVLAAYYINGNLDRLLWTGHNSSPSGATVCGGCVSKLYNKNELDKNDEFEFWFRINVATTIEGDNTNNFSITEIPTW